MKQILRLTWDDFDQAITEACAFLRKSDPVGIYGIPRGGLCLAVAISHRMDVPLLLKPERYCAIVDDIFQTGETMGKIIDKIGICDSWTWCKVSPLEWEDRDYVIEVPEDHWVLFPWEDPKRVEEDCAEYEERSSTPLKISPKDLR